jgi:hypothetical protein
MTDDRACFWRASTSVRGRMFLNAQIGAGSTYKRFLSFVLTDARSFQVITVVRQPPVENHCSRRIDGNAKASFLDHQISDLSKTEEKYLQPTEDR